MAAEPNFSAVANMGAALLGAAETNLQAPTAASLIVKATSARQFTDAGTTSGSTTLTSTSQAGFANGDLGRPVSGPGIPAGTIITAVASTTSATMSAPATATATNQTVSLGGGAGLKIEEIVVEASGTSLSPSTSSGLVYIFINDGTNYRLYTYITVTSVGASATSGPFRSVTPFINLWLPAGWSLYASQSVAGNASLLQCFAAGGAY